MGGEREREREREREKVRVWGWLGAVDDVRVINQRWKYADLHIEKY